MPWKRWKLGGRTKSENEAGSISKESGLEGGGSVKSQPLQGNEKGAKKAQAQARMLSKPLKYKEKRRNKAAVLESKMTTDLQHTVIIGRKVVAEQRIRRKGWLSDIRTADIEEKYSNSRRRNKGKIATYLYSGHVKAEGKQKTILQRDDVAG